MIGLLTRDEYPGDEAAPPSPTDQLALAENRAALTRDRLTATKRTIEEIDSRLVRLRTKRRAIEDSIRLTERAAIRSGLLTTRPVRANLQRLHAEAESARVAARELIQEAEPACAEYEALWTELTAAREEQMTALSMVQEVLAAKQEVERTTKDQRDSLAEELRLLEKIREQEAAERERELKWVAEGHYDPDYDAREIALRRARPWL